MKQREVGPDYIENLAQLVSSQGSSRQQLFAAAELELPDDDAGLAPVSAADYSKLYHEAVKLSDDECFGFFGPGRIPCGTLGILCEHLLPAQTLGEALQRASNFLNWMQKLQHRSAELKPHSPYSIREDVASLSFINQSSAASSMFVTQRAIASGLSSWHSFLCWLIDAPLPLLEVQFQGRCQLDEKRYLGLFKAPMRFQQDQTAYLVSASYLDAPVTHTPESLKAFLALAPYQLVGRLERHSDAHSLSNRIKHLLGDDFSKKSPGLEKIAKQLAIPARALKQGLEKEGISLSSVKDEARTEAAVRMLRDLNNPVDDVAHKLGFENCATFERNFAKWVGLSPRSYREQIVQR